MKKIIEQFKFCNTDTNILKKPEFWAYFYLAIGNFKIEKFEIAYEYSTKVIENFENIDLKNETKAGIFYMRAFCLVNPIFSKSKDELDNNDIVNLKKADEDLKEAMRLDSDYDYFALAGRINYYLKDYKNSLQYFNKAIDLCDNKDEKNEIKKEMGVVQTIIEEANAFVKSFIEAIKNSNVTEIEEFLNDEEKIIEMFNIEFIKNSEVWAYFYIAESYCKTKEYETAYDCYTKAISLMEETQNQDDTLKSLLFQNRAWNIFIMRKSNGFEDENVKKAFEDIENAIRFNPENFEIFVLKGWMYYGLNNKDMAIESLNKAKSICKNIKDKKEIQKHIDEINKEEEENIRMTEINNFIKNFIDAITNNDTNTIRSFLYEGENKIIEIFEASSFSDISKNPKAFAYYYIGIGYYRIGSYSLAIKYLTKAIEFIDSNIYSRIQSEIFLIRAICLSDNGKNVTEEAYNDILQAINYDNTYWYSHYLAGIMSMKLRNDKEIAFNHFVRAEDLCPNLEDKEYIQTLIKRLKDDHFWEELGEAANDGIEWVLDKAERILPIFSILD